MQKLKLKKPVTKPNGFAILDKLQSKTVMCHQLEGNYHHESVVDLSRNGSFTAVGALGRISQEWLSALKDAYNPRMNCWIPQLGVGSPRMNFLRISYFYGL